MDRISIIQDLSVPRDRVKEEFSKLTDNFTYHDSSPSGKEELLQRCKDSEIVVLVNQEMDADIINKLENLEMIAVSFTAYDHIDVDAAAENDVAVCNVPEYASESVAELVFCFMIAKYRHFLKCNSMVREEKLFDHQRPEIKGNLLAEKTLGIVGMGNIGAKVTEIAEAFQMDVVAHDEVERFEDVEYIPFHDLLKTSDIVSVHVPLTDGTKGLIGGAELSIMKEDAMLINAAPPELINREAFIEFVRNEKLQFGLDMGIHKNLPDDVIESERVYFTPHIGFYTHEALEKKFQTTVYNIEQYMGGNTTNLV